MPSAAAIALAVASNDRKRVPPANLTEATMAASKVPTAAFQAVLGEKGITFPPQEIPVHCVHVKPSVEIRLQLPPFGRLALPGDPRKNVARFQQDNVRDNELPAMAAHKAFHNLPAPHSLGVARPRLDVSRSQPVGVREIHRSRRSTLPVSWNFLPEDGRSKCSFQSALRGPRASSMSLLSQALTLGLALV